MSTQSKKSYSDLLLDPRWQRKRLEVYQRDKFKCQVCGSDQNTLSVHHRKYKWGLKPWEYPNHMLVTLCLECHKREQNPNPKNIESIIESLRSVPLTSQELTWFESILYAGIMAGDVGGIISTAMDAAHCVVKAIKKENWEERTDL